MDAVFLEMIHLGIASCFLILTVIVIRGMYTDMPKWVRCILWGLVAVRLLSPSVFESRISLLPDIGEVMHKAHITNTAGFASGSWIAIAETVWIIGAAGLLMSAFIHYIKIRRSVSEAVPVRDNILCCDTVKVPFVLGIVRPKIYIPSGLDEAALSYVLSHEKIHIKRGDHLWKLAAYMLLSVYWFHPLVWLSYILFCRDLELACDESVIRKYSAEKRKSYAEALLSCSMQRRTVLSYPLAFNEVAVKDRVEAVIRHRDASWNLILCSLLVCLAAAACFLTSPVTTDHHVRMRSQVSPGEPVKIVTFQVKTDKNSVHNVNVIARKNGPFVDLFFDTDFDDTSTEYNVSFTEDKE